MATKTYAPETAADFFDEIEAAIALRPQYRRVYHALNEVFRKCLNQLTSDTRLNFGGDFAKTDYLLKEHEAPKRLVKATNDTRVRLRKRYELSDDDLARFCLFDLKNLCQFIAFVYHTDVPPRLVGLFPTEKVPSFTPALVSECMRVIVDSWDDASTSGPR